MALALAPAPQHGGRTACRKRWLRRRSAEADSDIGNIEGRPVVYSHMQIDPVNNFHARGPIDQVVHRTAEYHHKTRPLYCRCRRLSDQLNNEPCCEQRYRDKQVALPPAPLLPEIRMPLPDLSHEQCSTLAIIRPVGRKATAPQ